MAIFWPMHDLSQDFHHGYVVHDSDGGESVIKICPNEHEDHTWRYSRQFLIALVGLAPHPLRIQVPVSSTTTDRMR